MGKNEKALAHRLAWFIDKGDIPDGLCVLHLCDNPPCCNVEHLMLGDRAENLRQTIERGHFRYGSNRSDAKLDEDKVVEIRRRYKTGDVTQQKLADEYGVHRMTIKTAITGKSWRRVP